MCHAHPPKISDCNTAGTVQGAFLSRLTPKHVDIIISVACSSLGLSSKAGKLENQHLHDNADGVARAVLHPAAGDVHAQVQYLNAMDNGKTPLPSLEYVNNDASV
jgi:hypothetical protein